jgi:DNA recombination protein RmuC
MSIFIAVAVMVLVIPATVYIVVRIFSRRIESDVLARIQDSFSKASLEALSQNTDQFLKLAKERLSKETQTNTQELAAKKELIDSTLQQMKAEMEKVENLMAAFEKDRDQKFGALSKGLQTNSEQTARLQEVTGKLNTILSDSRQRGLWGQRIADDILRMVGMEEGINYIPQKTLSTSAGRPDFTFILPGGKIINMDVKFPLDNFKKYLEETNEGVRQGYKNQFFKDARIMIKQVTSRDYINTDANTLDFAIVFIPLEQAYAFIMENDSTFMDDALKSKVILCSPWTLYAMLAIIRQSIDNFNLERSAHKILELMNSFYKQWDNYLKGMEKMGKKIEELQSEYMSLVTTRRNQLEKPLQQIEQLSRQREFSEHELSGPTPNGTVNSYKNNQPNNGM